MKNLVLIAVLAMCSFANAAHAELLGYVAPEIGTYSSPREACNHIGAAVGNPMPDMYVEPITFQVTNHAFRWFCLAIPPVHGSYVPISCQSPEVDGVPPEGCFPPNLYPKNLGRDPCCAGDPIGISLGNVYEEKADYKGVGEHSLSLIRSYNSMNFTFGSFGVGWTHNFERKLDASTPTFVTAFRPDGKSFVFVLQNGVYTTDPDVTLNLTAVSPSGYQLTDLTQTVENYDANGVLKSVHYRDGYQQTLCYDVTGSSCYSNNSGRLVNVTDSFGRSIGFTYNAAGLISVMTDPTSQPYQYNYVTLYNTSASTFPNQAISTVGYPTSGGAHPTITFHYDKTDRPSYLTSVTDELNNALASWTYDSDGRALTS